MSSYTGGMGGYNTTQSRANTTQRSKIQHNTTQQNTAQHNTTQSRNTSTQVVVVVFSRRWPSPPQLYNKTQQRNTGVIKYTMSDFIGGSGWVQGGDPHLLQVCNDVRSQCGFPSSWGRLRTGDTFLGLLSTKHCCLGSMSMSLWKIEYQKAQN